MSIVINTILFLISLLCVFYLALKFRYFRDRKNVIQKRKFKNVVDVTLVVSILIFCILHVNSYFNSMQNGQEQVSYLKYIIACIVVYFVWAYVNVKMYRQELKKLENTKKKRKK